MGTARPGGSRGTSQAAAAYAVSTTAVMTNGVDVLPASTSLTVARALIPESRTADGQYAENLVGPPTARVLPRDEDAQA